MHPPMRLLAGAGFAALSATPAFAVAQTPSISGNAWIALALLAALIAMIVLTVVVSIGLQRRDARLGRGDDSGFSLFGGDDDDTGSGRRR